MQLIPAYARVFMESVINFNGFLSAFAMLHIFRSLIKHQPICLINQ